VSSLVRLAPERCSRGSGTRILLSEHCHAVAVLNHTGPSFFTTACGTIKAVAVHSLEIAIKPPHGIKRNAFTYQVRVLVLERDLYRYAGWECCLDLRHAGSKVFLNASISSGACW